MKQISLVNVFPLILVFTMVQSVMGGEPEVSPSAAEDEGAIPSNGRSSTPQFRDVRGVLKEIQGKMYILEGTSLQGPAQFAVGQATAFPNGPKVPGQSIHALISLNKGEALIIR